MLPQEQFTTGQLVWLKLPGEDANYPMVVAKTGMIPGTSDMRYKLNNADGSAYVHPTSTEGWVDQSLLSRRD
jgi:hypothetical protein